MADLVSRFQNPNKTLHLHLKYKWWCFQIRLKDSTGIQLTVPTISGSLSRHMVGSHFSAPWSEVWPSDLFWKVEILGSSAEVVTLLPSSTATSTTEVGLLHQPGSQNKDDEEHSPQMTHREPRQGINLCFIEAYCYHSTTWLTLLDTLHTWAYIRGPHWNDQRTIKIGGNGISLGAREEYHP